MMHDLLGPTKAPGQTYKVFDYRLIDVDQNLGKYQLSF